MTGESSNLARNACLGDKGYKTQEKIKYKKEIINMITPNKKNQINNKNSKDDNIKLKKRYKIENSFGSIKYNNERIMLRKDHKIDTFLSWFYIGALEHNIKINKNRK